MPLSSPSPSSSFVTANKGFWAMVDEWMDAVDDRQILAKRLTGTPRATRAQDNPTEGLHGGGNAVYAHRLVRSIDRINSGREGPSRHVFVLNDQPEIRHGNLDEQSDDRLQNFCQNKAERRVQICPL